MPPSQPSEHEHSNRPLPRRKPRQIDAQRLPVSVDAPLVPVQISPQRLQSIGVKTGEVERKLVEDEIRTTGNVAVDETRLAYVQVRFSGFIQKVFADATYQFVRKGQPLFTIYSPDLVATEREYLVAKAESETSGAEHGSRRRFRRSIPAGRR